MSDARALALFGVAAIVSILILARQRRAAHGYSLSTATMKTNVVKISRAFSASKHS